MAPLDVFPAFCHRCHFRRVLASGATLSEPPHPGRYALLYTLSGRVLAGGTTQRISRISPPCQNPHTLAVTHCYTLYLWWFWQVAPPGAFPAFCRNFSNYCHFRCVLAFGATDALSVRTPTPWPLRSAIHSTCSGSGRWHYQQKKERERGEGKGVAPPCRGI